jgi:hypothetical protein
MDAMALSHARFAGEHRAQFKLMFSAVLETGAAGIGGGRNLRILEEMIRQGSKRVRFDRAIRFFWRVSFGLWFTGRACCAWTETMRNRLSSALARKLCYPG